MLLWWWFKKKLKFKIWSCLKVHPNSNHMTLFILKNHIIPKQQSHPKIAHDLSLCTSLDYKYTTLKTTNGTWNTWTPHCHHTTTIHPTIILPPHNNKDNGVLYCFINLLLFFQCLDDNNKNEQLHIRQCQWFYLYLSYHHHTPLPSQSLPGGKYVFFFFYIYMLH